MKLSGGDMCGKQQRQKNMINQEIRKMIRGEIVAQSDIVSSAANSDTYMYDSKHLNLENMSIM